MAQGSVVESVGETSGGAERSQTIGDAGIASTTFAADPDIQRRQELARFLKAKRAAISPGSVGLRPTRRRRAPGLLREEVAQRAGISPTWYAWLEQSREIKPSADVLELLADALLLNESERDHLKTLATPNPTVRWRRRFSSAAPERQGSWRGPTGGSPVQVRGSARLVVSVASWKATTVTKRTQRLCRVSY